MERKRRLSENATRYPVDDSQRVCRAFEYKHGWELVEGRPVFMGNTKQLHEAIKMAITEALIFYKSMPAIPMEALWPNR
jgi:hypothetical protein